MPRMQRLHVWFCALLQPNLSVKWTSRRIAASGIWSSADARAAFMRFFEDHGHQFVPSSSVIPNKKEGTYFTNAGMNQFKPLFLNTVDPRSDMVTLKRAVNSQKCIRVGGKHSDLEDVGQDLTHHTFFEMLGNWSFGDYFKEQSCQMALELLTSVYKLPVEQLYFTYFGGSTEVGLQPDNECREIWRSLGIPSERILPFGMKDNFWDMGDTGPCGPCTEIHYDHIGSGNRAALVNSGSADMVEIWNLVFMQYQRHEDGSLSRLPSSHVDTGMGLERILAVLNGSRSNYDSDLFQPLFAVIQNASGLAAYQGRVGLADSTGLDTAYRILADHARMYTVAIADGLAPSKNGLGHKLWQLICRCVHCVQDDFGASPYLLCDLVDHVAESLGVAFPEITSRKDLVKSTVAVTVERYLQLQQKAEHAFVKMQQKLSPKHLSGEMMWQLLDGKYGYSVPVNMILQLSKKNGITVDLEGFEQRLQQYKDSQDNAPVVDRRPITLECFESLQQIGVTTTDDSFKFSYSSSDLGYDFSSWDSLYCRVVGLVQGQEILTVVQEGGDVAVILDKTCFYAEGGGQVADVGMLVCQNGRFVVEDVQEFSGYVIHQGKQISGTLAVGDLIQPLIAQEKRMMCMRNHTATHLLQAALHHHLGLDTRQQGSSVQSDRLTFDFLCQEKLTNERVKEIENSVLKFIRENHKVHRHQLPLHEALSGEGIVTVPNEEYPAEVTLVQIGDPHDVVSKELCGGTHVLNTGDIVDFCITRVSQISAAVRRIYAVTGSSASESHKNGNSLFALCEEFSALVANRSDCAADLQEKSRSIRQLMIETSLLPHVVRDHANSVVETLAEYVAKVTNCEKQKHMRQSVEELLLKNPDSPYLVHSMTFEGKQMVKALSTVNANRPLALVSGDKKSAVVVIFWPQFQEKPVDSIQSLLTAAVADSNYMKLKSTVNEHGATVLKISVRGADLKKWLELSVQEAMDKLMAR